MIREALKDVVYPERVWVPPPKGKKLTPEEYKAKMTAVKEAIREIVVTAPWK